jgi:NAD(P)-dependent dehydrogenase (short-subunit alcohol dehydrogenase family)
MSVGGGCGRRRRRSSGWGRRSRRWRAAGVINLSRWIAREIGSLGITCNVVAPGPIRTRLTSGHAYDLHEIPLGRMGEPEEVAGAVAWLVGPDSAYVNGTVVDVDGGLVRA